MTEGLVSGCLDNWNRIMVNYTTGKIAVMYVCCAIRPVCISRKRDIAFILGFTLSELYYAELNGCYILNLNV
jgi:hypothetical protein